MTNSSPAKGRENQVFLSPKWLKNIDGNYFEGKGMTTKTRGNIALRVRIRREVVVSVRELDLGVGLDRDLLENIAEKDIDGNARGVPPEREDLHRLINDESKAQNIILYIKSLLI